MDRPSQQPLDIELALVEKGWCQGAVFEAADLRFGYHEVDAADGSLAGIWKKLKKRHRFVVVSQTCDIKAPLQDEPYVEVLVCREVKNPEFLWRLDRNSARWFVVDIENGLVAFAPQRILIHKEALATLTPISWPSTSDRLQRFIRWLARRYDRPAVPDPLVKAFEEPIRGVFERIEGQAPVVIHQFNKAIRELRASVPSRSEPPFDVHLILLARGEGVSRDEADAIEIVGQEIRASIDPSLVALDPDIQVMTEEQMPVRLYFATRPVYLDYMTYSGEEQEAAPPFPTN